MIVSSRLHSVLILAVALTQKTDPQNSSKAAAHMVRTGGCNQPRLDSQMCVALCSTAALSAPTLCPCLSTPQRQLQEVTLRYFGPLGFQVRTKTFQPLGQTKNISVPNMF